MKLLPNNTNGHLFTIRDNGNKWPSNLVGLSRACGLQKGDQVYQIELDKDTVVMLRASCCDEATIYSILLDKLKKHLQS